MYANLSNFKANSHANADTLKCLKLKAKSLACCPASRYSLGISYLKHAICEGCSLSISLTKYAIKVKKNPLISVYKYLALYWFIYTILSIGKCETC